MLSILIMVNCMSFVACHCFTGKCDSVKREPSQFVSSSLIRFCKLNLHSQKPVVENFSSNACLTQRDCEEKYRESVIHNEQLSQPSDQNIQEWQSITQRDYRQTLSMINLLGTFNESRTNGLRRSFIQDYDIWDFIRWICCWRPMIILPTQVKSTSSSLPFFSLVIPLPAFNSYNRVHVNRFFIDGSCKLSWRVYRLCESKEGLVIVLISQLVTKCSRVHDVKVIVPQSCSSIWSGCSCTFFSSSLNFLMNPLLS